MKPLTELRTDATLEFPCTMKIIAMVCLILALTTTGCSNRQVYQTLQQHQRSQCIEVPETQYDECMAAAGGSYEEYEHARKNSSD